MSRAGSTPVPASRPAMRAGFLGNVRGGRSELPGRARKELPAPRRERASARRACALLLVLRMITMTPRRWIVAAVALIAPAGLAPLALRDAGIVQRAHPDPPVANIGRLYASVHWRALLAGRVVGDILIDRPVV